MADRTLPTQRAMELREVMARVEPVISRLRERATHCKELARQTTSNKITTELLAVAGDCEHDAIQLEQGVLLLGS